MADKFSLELRRALGMRRKLMRGGRHDRQAVTDLVRNKIAEARSRNRD